MTQALRLTVLLSFAFVIISAEAWPQAIATADLHLIAKDPHGARIRNALVTVFDNDRAVRRSLRSNADGECTFIALPPDVYYIRAEADGFATALTEDVRLTVGQIANLTIVFTVASVSDSLTVKADPNLVETQRSSITTTIDQKTIDNLPINGRNYINFALTDSKLARDAGTTIGAAPTSGINFGGQRARSNLVNVDGADFIDNSTNGVRGTVSQDAVQEFQILTNGFAAEYGRASGGVVNIVTKSGTSQFHGTAFGFLRNRHIQATNPFNVGDDPPYTRVQAGVSIGGPLRKEKTFYFFSYENTHRRETGYSSIGAGNFELTPYDTAPLAPYLGLHGNSFGTILLTREQSKFMTDLVTSIQQLPMTQQSALLPTMQRFVAPYLTLAGGGSGIALQGALPSSAMLPVVGSIASRFSLPVPTGLNVFPTSGAALPLSFVTLNSIRGNYPITERTELYSLRLDHLFSPAQRSTVRVGFSPSYLTGIQSTQAGANFGQSAGSRSSDQNYHDWIVAAQHTSVVTANKVNELRFQYAYRGLQYMYSHAKGGSGTAVNIAGFALFGREPISYVNRTEERYQFADNFSAIRGRHTLKFGADINILPMSGLYTIQFGGTYFFGALRAGSLLSDANGDSLDRIDLAPFGLGQIPVPGFSPVQAYGLGIPQAFIQGVGNPYDRFSNKSFAGFLQDSWRIRQNLTMNYGIRYEAELTPQFSAANRMSQAAEAAMGITQGVPRDLNNFAPRVGLAWDPMSDGKSVVRASYGIFFDHPLMALSFLSNVADGTQAPQIALFGGNPGCGRTNTNFLNATNAFQGLLSCLPATFNYRPSEQRFNPAPDAPSIFVGQQFLAAGVPLLMQPFSMPVERDFQYSYANQASLGFERDLGRDLSFGIEYNFNGGRHLIRPNNANAAHGEILKLNYDRAIAAVNALAAAGVPASTLGQLRPSDPLSVAICPGMLQSLGLPLVYSSDVFVPAAMMSFFRRSGVNPSLLFPGSPLLRCTADASTALQEFGLGVNVPVPFSDLGTSFSNGTSAYHGMTATLRKRMNRNYDFLASYTWSHTIDDGSIDLQSGLGAQDANHPELERANSTLDQRHRFVFSGVFESGSRFKKGFSKILNGWTIAPIIEISSGRPFNIVTYTDRNLDLFATTDRPMVVPAGTAANACGDPAVSSRFSPMGFLQLPCYKDAIPTYNGNLGRNAGVKPWTIFNDLRVARRLHLCERVALDGIMDVFNVMNRFNVLDVNPLYTSAGAPTAAFDPRQFQFAIRFSW